METWALILFLAMNLVWCVLYLRSRKQAAKIERQYTAFWKSVRALQIQYVADLKHMNASGGAANEAAVAVMERVAYYIKDILLSAELEKLNDR